MYYMITQSYFNCRFCPCFFIHLLNTIPAIWLLEFDRLNRQLTEVGSNTTSTTSPTTNSSDNHGGAEALSSIEGVIRFLLLQLFIIYFSNRNKDFDERGILVWLMKISSKILKNVLIITQYFLSILLFFVYLFVCYFLLPLYVLFFFYYPKRGFKWLDPL